MKALVVDDDLVLADVVSFTLRRAGFDVLLAHDGRSALDRFDSEQPDLVILDVQIPEIDGLTVCRTIREHSATPIIMLTVRDTDRDIVEGLGLGADDYMTKPFSHTELVARVQSVMRRAGMPQPPRQLAFAGFSLDAERHTLESGDRPPVQLTALEVKLLEALMVNSGRVLPAQTLIDRIYGANGGDKAMLKQLVYRLRRKIEPEEGDAPVMIEAVPGVGYALVQRK